MFDVIAGRYKGLVIAQFQRASQRLYGLARDKGILEKLISQGIILRDRREDGYWTKERVYETAKTLYLKLGHFPRLEELREHRAGHVHYLAPKYFGGIKNLRSLLEGEVGEEIEKQRLEKLVDKYMREEKS